MNRYSIDDEKSTWGFLPSPATRPSFFKTVMPAGSRFGARELEAVRQAAPQVNSLVATFSGGNQALINQLARSLWETPTVFPSVQPAQVSYYQPQAVAAPPSGADGGASLEATVRSILNSIVNSIASTVANPIQAISPAPAAPITLPSIPQAPTLAETYTPNPINNAPSYLEYTEPFAQQAAPNPGTVYVPAPEPEPVIDYGAQYNWAGGGLGGSGELNSLNLY
jgi:hypothetical protein